MSDGRIVHAPERGHACAPGWTTRLVEDAEMPLGPGGEYAFPPDARLYPKGTVWQCGCGRTWVSTGPVAPNSPGFIDFRPERRWQRKRRERRATESGTTPQRQLDPPSAAMVPR